MSGRVVMRINDSILLGPSRASELDIDLLSIRCTASEDDSSVFDARYLH
jgi:hypothetical protein